MELKTSFQAHGIEPFYTGGPVALVDDLLATTFGDTVVLTDLSTGQKVTTLEGDGEQVTSLALAPSKSHVVICSRSLQMHVYGLPEGVRLKSIKAHEAPIMVCDIDPTSTLVATGGAEGAVKVWDISGGYATHNFRGHGGVISAVKFWGKQGSADWKLASGSDDCKVRVWDLVKNKCIAVLDNHVSVIRGLDFSGDGNTLISGGRDKIVSVWDGSQKYKLKSSILAMEVIETVGFLGDNIYTAGESGIVKLWNQAGKTVAQQAEKLKTSEETGVLQVIANGEHLYSVLTDQTIIKLYLHGDALIEDTRICGNHGEVIDCCFVVDNTGNQKLALATNSPEIRVISLDNPATSEILVGHRDIVISIDVSFGGTWLVSGGKDSQARLWHNNESKVVFTGHVGPIGAVAMSRVPIASPSALPSFIVTGSQDLTVKKWDPKSGSAVYTRKAHEKDINAIDISPDDRMFASASQDRTVKVWDSESGQVIGILKGHRRGVWTVKFSHYDKVVASGSGDKTIKLWSLNDYSCLRTFEGHSNSILKVAFFNKGLQLASAGGDGLAKIWEVKSGECVTTLDNHEDKVWSVAVDESTTAGDTNTRLITGGGDSVITIWEDITQEEKHREAEKMALQVEQEQELQNYIHSKDWKRAIEMALALDHPLRLLKLFTEVQNYNQGMSGLIEVDQVIGQLEPAKIARLLMRVRDWNTNARTSTVAHTVLYCILRTHNVSDLVDKIPGITELIDGILPYSERHYNRIDDLLEESAILDYALREMVI
jgi:U3 small nucleolar RNA-associated protein 13